MSVTFKDPYKYLYSEMLGYMFTSRNCFSYVEGCNVMMTMTAMESNVH